MLHGHQRICDGKGGPKMRKHSRKTFTFAGPFANDIKGMIEFKASLGHKEESFAWVMQTFDRYCLSNFPGAETLTQPIVFGFCQDGKDGKICGYRATHIREFGRYLMAVGKDAYVLPKGFFPQKAADLPYIMTDREITAFFDATDHYSHAANSPLVEYTVPVIFRLQFATGMRPQEARTLKRTNFNFSRDTIYIEEAKGHRDRRLVVHPSVMDMCRKYDIIAESYHPGRTYFFPSPDGTPYSHNWMSAKFHKCWKTAGNNASARICTPYDLRHNFATRTLMRWVEEGKDLNVYAPYLSTYMGHVSFSSTFYYIHLLPEKLAVQDFMDTAGIIPEVPHEN